MHVFMAKNGEDNTTIMLVMGIYIITRTFSNVYIYHACFFLKI